MLGEWMDFVEKLGQIDENFWTGLTDLIYTWSQVMDKAAVEYARVMRNHILEGKFSLF